MDLQDGGFRGFDAKGGGERGGEGEGGGGGDSLREAEGGYMGDGGNAPRAGPSPYFGVSVRETACSRVARVVPGLRASGRSSRTRGSCEYRRTGSSVGVT